MQTGDATDLARVRLSWTDLEEARAALADAVSTSNSLLFGWGLLSAFGPSGRQLQGQIDWLVHVALKAGHCNAWAVGDARHPSRWHQYTADKHGRTNGGDADTRLRAVLGKRELVTFGSVQIP